MCCRRRCPALQFLYIWEKKASIQSHTRRLNLLDLDGTTEETSPAGSDETDFLTGNGGAGHGRCLSDMLVVTTTVRMVDRVHGNTTSTGPAVEWKVE
jgi:hypothetical protein